MEIPDFTDVHILVVGDLMLDRYYSGETKRISPEAPVPVVHVDQMQARAGGAGNVALNIRNLGGRVSLSGFIGNDGNGDELLNHLKQAGIQCQIQRSDQARTITKLRVLSRHQQLIRLDFEDGFSALDDLSLLPDYQSALVDADVVVLSDYGKGTLSACRTFITLAREADIKVLVDPKGTDFTRYQGATVLTPNRQEFEAVVGQCENQQQLEQKGQLLMTQLDLDALLITQGDLGMTLCVENQQAIHFPTQAREVYDVTGAGDTVISTLASGLAAGLDFAKATMLANVAAGMVVGKLGAATVSVDEMRQFMQVKTAITASAQSLSELLNLVQQSKSREETIVLTNGCFDILHPGHLRYLQQAKMLGDRLIVLVNDDDSVARLKGKQRPVNPLSSRMEMLGALTSVDWVVAFSGDTPENEINMILPDILVKGGDYQNIKEIAGYDCVIANGGRVTTLPFSEGFSTTKMIETILNTE
ncbi:MAG TPA: bifunctional D-glycero-beta-D-manno-heptose-7-phosphate kinase/D-glycero-beta-D-manno-heptose 1-phosphate adenylyltransferase HldE [Crenotrichaceae bacterium]|nr:bifunctional D-glycero-beta-D-manno-heptose-7-phosphate kinase/D-glycero-beta-D-manno-heptose 1-phosphate adenylyltransferase HldE [Crenotrichaceae bacterium]